MNDYHTFLCAKQVRARPLGFEPGTLPEILFAWQKDVTRWSVQRGRAAIFAGCGLGKTFMQLAWADQVARHTGQPVLILAPPAVARQTADEEAPRLGLRVRVVSRQHEVEPGPSLSVTNYQKLLRGHFDPSKFIGVVLDESSILKAYMGRTKQYLMEAFADTPYRLACTATPAPNDHKELGNHAQFLGVMDSNEMLARWFIPDQSRVGHYHLKGHAEQDFWEWVASWAVCLDRPSDLGYPDEGYHLPEISYQQDVVRVDAVSGAAPGYLYRCDHLTATSLHKEMRLTASARARAVADLVNASSEAWVVWCNTDYEQDELVALIPGAVDVRGSNAESVKEAGLEAFTRGQARVIITKPRIAGYGLNWQHCRNTVFVGLSYSHEDFYQAVRRIWRFGQVQDVRCHVVIADTEGEVLGAIRRKEEESSYLRKSLIAASRRAGLRGDSERRLIAVPYQSEQGTNWTLHLGDCIEVIKDVPDESVDFTIFSPPFSNLYIYSNAEADMGNSADDEEFFSHFGYLVPHLLRVTVPGRLCAIHCKDLPRFGNRDGIAGLKDFPGRCVALFESHGWSFHSRVTIWKCPVTERERTNNSGLLHRTVTLDSSQLRQGMADYLLLFRRYPRESDGLLSSKPLRRREGLTDWHGHPEYDPRTSNRHLSPYARKKKPHSQSISLWQRLAEPAWWDASALTPAQFRATQLLLAAGMPAEEIATALGLHSTDAIWFDIDQTDVLNAQEGTAPGDERHICPLQLGLIRRAIGLWTDPGETVLSPFAGIGSEGVVALELRRRFVGIELKGSYFARAARHLAVSEEKAQQPGLFDHLEDEGAA